MRRYIKLTILIVWIIILSNIAPFVWMFKNFVYERHYRYSNYNLFEFYK